MKVHVINLTNMTSLVIIFSANSSKKKVKIKYNLNRKIHRTCSCFLFATPWSVRVYNKISNKTRPSESKSYAYKAVSIFDFSI
jgi:hypothetical protein